MSAGFSETVVMDAHAIIDEAANDVEGSVVAVDDEEPMKRSAYPAKGDAFAFAQEPSLVRHPLGGEGGERLSEPAGRVGEASATQGSGLLSLHGGVGTLLVDTVLVITVGPVLVEGVANDRAEVARQGTEIIAM